MCDIGVCCNFLGVVGLMIDDDVEPTMMVGCPTSVGFSWIIFRPHFFLGGEGRSGRLPP